MRSKSEPKTKAIWWHHVKLWLKKLPPFSWRQYWHEGTVVGLLAVSLPLLQFSHQDITVSEPQEVIVLLFYFAFIGFFLLATYWLWLKTRGERLLATTLAVVLLTTYYIQLLNIFPKLHDKFSILYALIVQVIVYILCGFIAKLAARAEPWIEARKFAKHPLSTVVICICIVTFIFNTYAFGAYLYSHRRASAFVPKNLSGSQVQLTKQSNRDIYYFVFDRYSSNDSLNNYFHYDNSAFLDTLRQGGFIVNDHAFSNYQYTAPSISSTVRMDYHTDMLNALSGKQPVNYLPYKTILENSPTTALLKRSGYDVYNFGNWWNPTRQQEQATNILPQFTATILGKHFILSEFQSNVISQSFLGGLLKRGLTIFGFTILKVAYTDVRELYISQVNNLQTLIKQPHSKPRYIFGHLLMPHPPYLFAADGSEPNYNSGDDNAGVPRETKYINQLEFANATITSLIASIKQNSTTDPIIIFQADEGPYPLNPVTDWKSVPTDTVKLKMGVLSAYYLPDVSSQAATALNSPVNIFRFIFNNYFGANVPYLPDCSYVFNFDEPFAFKNVSPLLGKPSTACDNR